MIRYRIIEKIGYGYGMQKKGIFGWSEYKYMSRFNSHINTICESTADAAREKLYEIEMRKLSYKIQEYVEPQER